MAGSQPLLVFASAKIESRFCSRCLAPMILTGIKPASLSFDLRTFDCVKCGHIETKTSEAERRRPFFDMLPPPLQREAHLQGAETSPSDACQPTLDDGSGKPAEGLD